MWIVGNFPKEATEARNYEEITAFNIKNTTDFFFSDETIGKGYRTEGSYPYKNSQ